MLIAFQHMQYPQSLSMKAITRSVRALVAIGSDQNHQKGLLQCCASRLTEINVLETTHPNDLIEQASAKRR
jgi:hypothetical protein